MLPKTTKFTPAVSDPPPDRIAVPAFTTIRRYAREAAACLWTGDVDTVEVWLMRDIQKTHQ
jgi:hypothetical protein